MSGLFSLCRLSITNFRSIRETQVIDFEVFQPGLYYVQGQNLVEPRLGSNGAAKSSFFVDAVNWNLTGRTARSRRPGSAVENWFAKGETTRVVLECIISGNRLVIDRSRNPNRLSLDGRIVEQQEIDRLLPLSDSAFSRSILIDQFGDKFLSLPAEEKSRLFSDTLDLDKWVEAAERAGDARSRMSEQRITLERVLAVTIGSIETTREALREAEEAEKAYEASLDKQLKDLAARKAEAARLDEEAMDTLNKARDGWASVEELRKLALVVEEDKVKLKKMRSAYEVYTRSHAGTGTSIDTLTKRLESYTGDVCPECGQKTDPEHLKIKRRQAKQDIEAARDSLAEITKILDDLRDAIKLYEEGIEDDEKKLVDWRQQEDRISVAAEHSLNVREELHRIGKQIDDLRAAENPHTTNCDRLGERLKKLRKQKTDQEESVDLAGKLEAVCEFWRKGFREIRLNEVDTALAEFEIATNHHAETLGLEGWEIAFDTERETKSGNVSHKFSVTLFPPKQDDPVPWESYSGGESQRWQLASTFGIAEILLARSGVVTDIEVLDEPTIHLSPEGIDDLLACLYDRAHDLKRRIFVIDHHALDRGAFDGIVTITKDEQGSRIDTGRVIQPIAVEGSKSNETYEPDKPVQKKRERVRL